MSDWIVSRRVLEVRTAPSSGVEAGDDFHLSRVQDTPVAEYLVIEHEFLIVCRQFRLVREIMRR